MKIMTAKTKTDAPMWLVCLGPDTGIYAYLQETNTFHYSHPLDIDHRWDMKLTYSEVTSEVAVALINDGIGLVPTLNAHARNSLKSSDLRFSAREVLGSAASAILHAAEKAIDVPADLQADRHDKPTESHQ